MLAIAKKVREKSVSDLVPAGGSGSAQPKVEDIKRQILDWSKPAFTIHQANGNKALNSFRAALKKAVKMALKNKKKAGGEQTLVPPVAQKLIELTQAAAHDLSNVANKLHLEINDSIDEAYLIRDATLKNDLEKIKGLTGTCNWLHKELEKKNSDLSYAMASHKPAVSKLAMAVLREKLPTWIVGDIPIPNEHEVLKEEIFSAQAWAQAELHLNAGVTPYGLPEIRMLFSGSYIVAGVRTDKLRGNSLKEKIEHTLTEQGFREFLASTEKQDEGFWVVHDIPYTSIMIPAGHIIITCGFHSNDKDAKGCDGMRWSYLPYKHSSSVVNAKNRLCAIMETYPDLNTDEYAAWRSCLDRYLIG